MKKDDIIREVQTFMPPGMDGYQICKAIVNLASAPEGTVKQIGKRPFKRPMLQSEAARHVAKAKARIELADAPD